MKRLSRIALAGSIALLLVSCTSPTENNVSPSPSISASPTVTLADNVTLNNQWSNIPQVDQVSSDQVQAALLVLQNFSAAAYANPALLSGQYEQPGFLSSQVDSFLGPEMQQFVAGLNPQSLDVDDVRDLNSMFNVLLDGSKISDDIFSLGQGNIALSLSDLQVSYDEQLSALKVSYVATSEVPVQNKEVSGQATYRHDTTAWMSQDGSGQWIISGYLSNWSVTPPA